MRRYRSRLFALAVLGAVVALLLSGTAAAAPTPKNSGAAESGQPSGGQAKTADTSDPAPAGFRQQLIDIYGQMTQVATKYPPPPDSDVSLPGVASFTQSLDALTQDQLDTIYSSNPSAWDQVQQALDTVLSSEFAADTKRMTPAQIQPSKSQNAKTGPKIQALSPNAESDPLPPLPDVPDCADESTFEGLHAASFAMQATSYGLQVAQDALSIGLSFAPRDIVLVVAGEGGTVDADPIWTVQEDIVLGLSIAQHTVDFAQNTIDYNATKINDCYGVQSANELGFNFEAIQVLGTIGNQSLDNEANISAAIDTGFAQTYQKLANLQTSVNTAQASLDLALKQRIESALLGSTTSPLTDFELPNSAGGYLDATPIGVKVIVTDALAAMKANGQSVVSTAPKLLTLANGYLASGKYKKAFAEYQLAYQAIAQP